MLKHTFGRKTTALTLRMLRKHPEIVNEHKVPGRISLKGRIEYHQKLYDLLPIDAKMKAILFDHTISETDASKKIATHALDVNKTPNKARKSLEKLHAELVNLYREAIPTEEIKTRLLRRLPIATSDPDEFRHNLTHMPTMPIVHAAGKVEDAIRLIKK